MIGIDVPRRGVWVKTNIHDTRGNNLRFLTLRREIQEGLNVIEHWNSANDFILFGKSSEIVTNRREDQELTMLALHLLQNSLVYINTLMLSQVLAEKAWENRLTDEDLRGLTPLFYGHTNPYARSIST